MSRSAWHKSLFDAAKRVHHQLDKSGPPIHKSKKVPKEKKMTDELKLFRITIAARMSNDSPSNLLDSGCELLVLGTNGEDVCAKILDEMPDSPTIPYERIKITEIEGPFDHGTILSWTTF